MADSTTPPGWKFAAVFISVGLALIYGPLALVNLWCRVVDDARVDF